MDPTFGSQELLESLSQSSAKSRQSKDSKASKGSSRGSSNSSLASTHTNPVEDAYRRIGQGLSQRAQGSDGDHQHNLQNHLRLAGPRPQRARLGTHPCTSFQKFQRPAKKPFNPHEAIAGHPHPPQGGPSPKIAKLGRYQDQHHLTGDSGHGGDYSLTPSGKPSQRLLKQITLQAKETFYKWRRQQKAGYLNKYAPNQPGSLSTSASSGQTSATSLGTSAGGGASYDQYARLTEQQLLYQQQSLSTPHNGPSSYDSPSSSQRYAFSQMALQQHGSSHQPHLQHQQHLLNHHQHSQHQQDPAPKGLLSAVLEGGSESTYESESVHSLPTINSQKTGMSKASSVRTAASGAASNAYHQYPGPSSLQSGSSSVMQQQQQSSLLHHSMGGGGGGGAASTQPALHYAAPRGPCLTQPSEPVGNDGLDNVEGNVILHQNDILVVPGRTNNASSSGSHSNSRSGPARGLEFHVQSLLGQGTFAQVFCCWESVSKKRVALKIVKNKPAFTKQAAVEIEVFQALVDKHKANEAVEAVGGSTPASPHMVHLLSSFMYKSHLCLVFELLGLNLYEVLKRRQFRGLPLPMVRTLVKQALEGVKELANKTIVHCDLKPENILLVSEEVEKEVVGAGEGKQQQQQQKSAHETDAMSTSGSVASLASMSSTTSKKTPQTIKLIDFGSACFEGYSAHTYIQSRFYRSPEVLMGLPYDSAIDMWSLGCVAAELFLGLPILPGVHEHDQCGRIIEMIGEIPDWMLEQGSKATKYYVKYVPRSSTTNEKATGSTHSGSNNSGSSSDHPSNSSGDPLTKTTASSSTDLAGTHRPLLPQWRLKTQEEYIKSLTQNEIRKKGGLAKLEKQPTNRYFKRTKLSDIIMLHGQHCVGDEKELLGMFVHFLYGLLDPDPWKRWTAYQASQHPFITGVPGQLRKKTAETKLDYREENQANGGFDVYWQPPWDPGICRRKLLNVQRMREKQNAQRRGYSQSRPSSSHGVDGQDNVDMRSASRGNQKSPSMNSVNSRQPMMVADSPSVSHMSVDGGRSSPPSQITSQLALHAQRKASSAVSAGSMPKGSSSLSAIGNSGLQAALAMENPARYEHLMRTPTNSNQRPFTGPQSYTGLGYENEPGGADFGYALQRPGNIPGLGSDAATVASQASIGSSQAGISVSSGQPLHLQQQQYGRMHQNQNSLPRYSAGNSSNSVNSLPNSTGYSGQPNMMVGGGVSYQGYGNSLEQGGIQYLAAQQQLLKQRAREQQQQQQQQQNPIDQLPPHMMTPEYHHQLLIQEQQKQLAALQEQHQRQLASLQQQQQLAFQQQQQQFLNQQYGTTGSGYYYVTSADGTPMLMQQPGLVGSMGGAVQGSFDGSAGGGYMMPPHQHQRTPSFDDGGGASRSVRDNRTGRRMSRGSSGGRGNDGYRGGPGMSM